MAHRVLDDIGITFLKPLRERWYHRGHSIVGGRFSGELVFRYFSIMPTKQYSDLRHYLWREIDYCLDAPELIPAGSMIDDALGPKTTDHFPRPSWIERDKLL